MIHYNKLLISGTLNRARPEFFQQKIIIIVTLFMKVYIYKNNSSHFTFCTLTVIVVVQWDTGRFVTSPVTKSTAYTSE